MIQDLLSKALMIILVGMGVVFLFILFMVMAINLNARILKVFGKEKEQSK